MKEILGTLTRVVARASFFRRPSIPSLKYSIGTLCPKGMVKMQEREREFHELSDEKGNWIHELSDEKGKENYHSAFGRYNFEVTPLLNH